MFRRALAALLTVLVAILLLISAWPQLFGLAQAPVVAQEVSLRGLAVAIAAACIVVLTLIALLASSLRRFCASLAVVLLVFSGITIAVLSTRGFGNAGFESAGNSDVTVLSWNTLGGAPGAHAIADLATQSGAEVIALPETTNEVGQAVANLMAASGTPMQVFTVAYDEVSTSRSTTLLISEGLGAYTVDDSVTTTSVLPSVVAHPTNGNGPTIIAVHAVAPIPGEMEHWRSDLRWVAGACGSTNVIMAGDFNSTLDHYAGLATTGTALGACSDAAEATGNAAVGTWPTLLPVFLGAPIDHVMTTPNWKVTGMRVIQSQDGAGSDHRPILAQLSPAG
jgi:endonuclease/exonuclease/phosphatase (EEP) superfamily protein YafD